MKFNVVFILLLVFVFTQCSKSDKEKISPQIFEVGQSWITITWESRKEYKGRILYKRKGSADEYLIANDDIESNKHEVSIKGLESSARYVYLIEGYEQVFQFQTKPLANNPFSFLIVKGDSTSNFLPVILEENCEFVLSENEIANNYYSHSKAYVPIFSISKNQSIDWGGLRLILNNQIDNISSQLDGTGKHTLGIISSDELLKNSFENDQIVNLTIHQTLCDYNIKNSSSPVSFVGILKSSTEAVVINNICYVGMGFSDESQSFGIQNAIVVNVDEEIISSTFLADKNEVVLKASQIQGRKTCKECRRLAEKGAYEESIKAYEEFINNNQGHFQIDDAYFAIAEIYDEKLFFMSDALEWYKRLIRESPSSTLAPIALQRINYISDYSDFDFIPLSKFERIKKIEFARNTSNSDEQIKLLYQVEQIISDYSKSKLAPIMKFWVANQYRNLNPEKAIKLYITLQDQYPDFKESRTILLEIGETYYVTGQLKEALIIYNQAYEELPAHRELIEAQLTRIKRNLKREDLHIVSLIIFCILFFGTISIKPFGINRRALKYSIILAFGFGALLFLSTWIIREEFSSLKELILFVNGLTILLFVSSSISLTIKTKIRGNSLNRLVSSIFGIMIFLSGFYQVIYYINIHYLVIFKL